MIKNGGAEMFQVWTWLGLLGSDWVVKTVMYIIGAMHLVIWLRFGA